MLTAFSQPLLPGDSGGRHRAERLAQLVGVIGLTRTDELTDRSGENRRSRGTLSTEAVKLAAGEAAALSGRRMGEFGVAALRPRSSFLGFGRRGRRVRGLAQRTVDRRRFRRRENDRLAISKLSDALKRGVEAPVATLPFLLTPEVELEDLDRLSRELERKL